MKIILTILALMALTGCMSDALGKGNQLYTVEILSPNSTNVVVKYEKVSADSVWITFGTINVGGYSSPYWRLTRTQ